MDEALQTVIRSYRATLPDDRRLLLERFRYVDAARKVVGVGSVGTRAWIMLLLGRDNVDPLFLQFKEAEASVLEPYLPASRYKHHGQRVVEGQRLMQAAGDIMLGWVRTSDVDDVEREYYVRQLWDAKGSARIEVMDPTALAFYAGVCGRTLARAHARAGDSVAIAAYLGGGDRFDRALAQFAEAYADQNELDYAAVQKPPSRAGSPSGPRSDEEEPAGCNPGDRIGWAGVRRRRIHGDQRVSARTDRGRPSDRRRVGCMARADPSRNRAVAGWAARPC